MQHWFGQVGQWARLKLSGAVWCHSFIINSYNCRVLWHNYTCFISWKLLGRCTKVACTVCPGFSQATKAILTAPVSSRRVEILPLSKLENKSTVYQQASGEQGVFTMFLSVCVCWKPGWAVLHYPSRSWGTGALAERLKGIFNTTWSAAVKPRAQIGVGLRGCGMCPAPISCFSATMQSPSSLKRTQY